MNLTHEVTYDALERDAQRLVRAQQAGAKAARDAKAVAANVRAQADEVRRAGARLASSLRR